MALHPRSRAAALILSIALVATACGVPDDIATEDAEVTLETLTPVAPADADTQADDAVVSDSDDDAPATSTTASPATNDAVDTTEAEGEDPEGEDPEGEAATDDDVAEPSTTTEASEDTDGDPAEAPATTEAETETTTEAPTTTEATTTTTTTPTTTEAPTTVAAANRALPDIDLELELVASLSSPVAFATRPGTSDIFIGEQGGRIVRLPNGGAAGADTTLDIRGSVSLGNEQGLLGIAFAPDGQRLYVNYTNSGGATVIARYTMSGNSASSPETLMTIAQPFGNHNGGQLVFGPDGLLYIGLGDGGSSGDPQGHGQNPNSLLGSILRIDVSGASGYTIPAGNPFPNGGAPEVFVWGIRNAWRFGFDSANGDLWIADVGQDRVEEVTVLRSGTAAGANLGWNLVEGNESFRGLAAPDGHRGPVLTYAHGSGRCSITGGEVYRSGDIAGLGGTYLYGDFCTGEVFGFRANGQGTPQRLSIPNVDRPSSFGLGSDGQPYVLSRGGGVFRIVES